MTPYVIDILLLFLMAYACYMPEVFLFTDTQLLPKWYLLIAASLVWILWKTNAFKLQKGYKSMKLKYNLMTRKE